MYSDGAVVEKGTGGLTQQRVIEKDTNWNRSAFL